MSNPSETPKYRTQNNDEQSIDIKSLVYIFLHYWYLFLISAAIAVGCGWLYNRFKTPEYQISGTVMVKDDRSGLDPTAIMTRSSFSSTQNLDNEIAILKSYSLCEQVVKKMDLEVGYYDNSRFVTTELYKNTPFTVIFDETVPQAVNLHYDILINGETLSLKAKADYHSEYDYTTEQFIVQRPEEINISGDYQFDEWIDTGYNRFMISKTSKYQPHLHNGKKMSFCFYDYLTLTRRMRSFTVAPISKQASILSVGMTGENRQKMVEFVNTLMDVYVNRGLERKNSVSENTIQFIDEQLSETESSLNKAEVELQEYRSAHDLTNIDAQSRQVISSLKALEENHAALLVNQQYYKRLQSYIQENINNPDNLAAPSAMGISDPLLNKLVQDLVNLNQQKASLLLTLTEEHPQIVKIDEQIVTTKRTLLENINNLVEKNAMSINDVENRIRKSENESRNLPQKERMLIGYERKFKLNQDTYNYLMQRRAEAQILKASNTPDNEIIDYASTKRATLVAPRRAMNLLVALIIGLLIPALILFLRDYFNLKIQTRKDVEKATSFPIIGQIGLCSGKDPLVVINKPKSPVAEAFRSVRTNIDFITQNKPKSTILVTGDMQSVGKTFNSINIASIYALYGKKTLLLGFDMRKPKLFQEFGLTNNVGLSSYLSNKNSLDEVIQNTGKIESLDLIPSGPIPPNPAELIASDKCAELFEELKKRYDYIIIDTPPLGLVTDAFLLMKYSDANIYIVRQGHTDKNIFASIIQDIEQRGLKVNIVINGVHQEGGYGYGKYHYGYGYGYSYSYGGGKYGSYGDVAEGYYSDYDDGKKKAKRKKQKDN
ncbi:MAG: polysaccharide biosynthesis tyrosine autokinase [Bacteroidales bacterium]|nr:polysaccharide biosynthesis tyrosine autokinase [Bacteroidales bacterium]